MRLYSLASVDEVPPNTMRAFTVAGRRVLVANLAGQFHALDDLCPHLAVPLSRGEVKEGCVVCPGHGSMFDLRTGEAKRWVGKPITWLTRLAEGRPSNARVYRLIIENGQILLEL